jgi:hypothetical protein
VIVLGCDFTNAALLFFARIHQFVDIEKVLEGKDVLYYVFVCPESCGDWSEEVFIDVWAFDWLEPLPSN